ncbi:MAG: hypothetical protein AB4372_13315 [Xenococcus sp. (in: cyanobacteria)]
MQSLNLRSKVDANGKLSLQLPKELANQELDLIIVYQKIMQTKPEELHDVVDNFYGCLSEDPILLEEQTQQEIA